MYNGSNSGEITFSTGVDTKGLEKGISEIKDMTEDLNDIEIEVSDTDVAQGLADSIDDLIKEYKELTSGPVLFESDLQRAEEIKIQVQQMVDQIEKLTGEKLIIKGFTEVDNSLSSVNKKLNSMGRGLEKIGKKISRIGLSMIGIHSIYGMISSSISRVKEGNEEISNSITAINNVLDEIIGRLLQALLPFINMLVAGISIIAEALFGIDVTSNTFSKNMKNANKSAGQLRKQLMGFDEMNVLNGEGGTGLLGGNSGGIGDTNGIGKLKDMIEKGKKVIDDFNETMDDINEQPWLRLLDKLFGGGAGTGFFNPGGAGWKLFGIDFRPSSKTGLTEYYSKYFDQVKEIIKNGNAEIGEEYVKFTTEFGDEYLYTTVTWNRLLKDLEEGVATYGSTWYELETEIIPQYQEQMQRGLKQAVRVGAKGAIKNVKDLRKNFINDWNDMVSEIPLLSQAVLDGNYEIKKDFVDITLQTGDVIRVTKDQFNGLETFLKSKATNLLNVFKNNSNATSTTIQAGIDAVGVKSEETGNKIQAKAGSLTEAIKGAFNNTEQNSNSASKEVKNSWIIACNDIISKFTGRDNNGVLGAVTGVFDELQQKGNSSGQKTENTTITYTQETIDKMNKIINNYNPPTITLKTSVNLNTVQSKINDFVNNVKNLVGFTLSATGHTGGGRYGAKGLLLGLPHLASGGIINRPGKGVPLAFGGAIAGERGREAVLPLTDTQQMEYLGREIAKNVIINLTNVTELDGRQIARSVTQVMNDMQFASNGGVI